MSPDLILVLSLLILTLAIFGQCLFGFGSGLIAIPTLGLLISLKDAVTLSLIVQMVSVIFLIRIYDTLIGSSCYRLSGVLYRVRYWVCIFSPSLTRHGYAGP